MPVVARIPQFILALFSKCLWECASLFDPVRFGAAISFTLSAHDPCFLRPSFCSCWCAWSWSTPSCDCQQREQTGHLWNFKLIIMRKLCQVLDTREYSQNLLANQFDEEVHDAYAQLKISCLVPTDNYLTIVTKERFETWSFKFNTSFVFPGGRGRPL